MSKLKIVRMPDDRIWFVEARKSKTNIQYFLEGDDRVDRLPPDFYQKRKVLRYGVLVTADLQDDADWVVFEQRRQRDEFIAQSTDGKIP